MKTEAHKTLWDEFAIAALPAILQGQVKLAIEQREPMSGSDYRQIAKRAYRMADAMLATREKVPNED
jgi:hypothetical protein